MTVLEAIPLDKIRAEAANIRPLHTLLTLIAGIFYVLGWVAFKTFAIAWATIAWSVAAIKVGFMEAKAADAAKRKATR